MAVVAGAIFVMVFSLPKVVEGHSCNFQCFVTSINSRFHFIFHHPNLVANTLGINYQAFVSDNLLTSGSYHICVIESVIEFGALGGS